MINKKKEIDINICELTSSELEGDRVRGQP